MGNQWLLHTEIYEALDLYIAGNEEAKNKLSVLGHLYGDKCLSIEHGIQPTSLPRLNIFITGTTGSGKSFAIETLADILGLPVLRVDCSSLAQVGWQGEGLDDYLSEFSSKLGIHGFGVIVLDEFDKLGNHQMSTSGRSPTFGIQYNLLDLLDGKYSHPKVHPNINNCLVVCAGAFSDATKNAEKDRRSIGFAQEHFKPLLEWKEIMIDGGIVPELAGRLVDVVVTASLTKKQIREIIMLKHGTAFSKYRNLCQYHIFTAADIDFLVDGVYGSKYGMRELDTKLFNLITKAMLKRVGK